MFGYESYIDTILSRILRSANGVDQNERLCLLCNTNDMEDEFHFMFMYYAFT